MFGFLADFLSKISNCFALTLKKFKKHFFVRKNLLLSKRSSRLEESSFDKLSEKALLKDGSWQNGSSNIRKCDKISSLGSVIFNLDNASKNFSATSQHLTLKIWKNERNFILNSIVFLKKFVWANRSEFWHSCWFCLPELWNLFALNPKSEIL